MVVDDVVEMDDIASGASFEMARDRFTAKDYHTSRSFGSAIARTAGRS
jgi:hypothetical protein